MKQKILILALAAALAGGAAVAAETGQYVLSGLYTAEQTTSTGKLFVDLGSRARSGGKVTVTVLAVFDTPVTLGRDDMDHSVVEMEMDCTRGVARVLRGGAYRPDGTLISERTTPDDPSPPASDPDKRAIELACGAAADGAKAFGSRAEALTWARKAK
jgi:hypothetical protein